MTASRGIYAKRGSGSISAGGYRRHGAKKIGEHVLVAEKAMGKPLPPGAVVHHWSEVKDDNRGENLVVCPNQSYHRLLHDRAEAYDATGNADSRRCHYCHQWDLPAAMRRGAHWWEHVACSRQYFRDFYARKKLRA